MSLTVIFSFYVPLLESWKSDTQSVGVFVCLLVAVCLSVCIYSQPSTLRESVRALCSPVRTHHDWAFCLN